MITTYRKLAALSVQLQQADASQNFLAQAKRLLFEHQRRLQEMPGMKKDGPQAEKTEAQLK